LLDLSPQVRVEQAEGMLAESFALVQTLALKQFDALAEELGRGGYRPIRFRPYRLGQDIRVAAVWTRDGRPWRLLQGVTAQEVRRRNEELRPRGFQPVDVCGWLDPSGPPRERYAALWGQETGTRDAQLQVGVLQERYEQDGSPSGKPGLVPLTFQALYGADGKRRINAVWGRLTPSPRQWLRGEVALPSPADELPPEKVQMDIDVRPAPRRTPRDLARAELRRWTQQVRANSRNLVARYWQGVAHSRLGNNSLALDDFTACLETNPRDLAALAERAHVLARLGRTDDALGDLDQVRLASITRAVVLPFEALLAVYRGETPPWPALKALADRETDSPHVLFDVAVVHAQAAERARGRQPGLCREHQDRAVVLLEQAVKAGLPAGRILHDDLRLEPLHDNAGYWALLIRAHRDQEDSRVWHAGTAAESVEELGLSPAQHLARCRALAGQGYRPVALAVAEAGPSRPLAASVWQRPRPSEAAREALARRQAGVGLALLKLGDAEAVWPLLRHSAYPEARSRLVLRLGPAGVEVATLVDRLLAEQDVSVRRALILALGEYRDEQVPARLRERLVTTLLDWYRRDPDPGVHGAIDWLLRHGRDGAEKRPLDWKRAQALEQIDEELASPVALAPGGKRRWYVNRQGQTLAVVEAKEPFLMGAPADEAGRASNELLHWQRIGRRYAIGTKPVTVAQFRRFQKTFDYPREFSPADDGPIIRVTWYEAARYCNWLSEQEGIPQKEWCYPVDVTEGVRLSRDHLRRTGYRLPTEAEWEYACRAGAATSNSFGSSRELLPRFSWYIDNTLNRTWPVGQKRPNDLGLFDMHGNVWTWCQEGSRGYSPSSRNRPSRDEEDTSAILDRSNRVLRGGSFLLHPSRVRAAFRNENRPTARDITIGLRVARTLP
jgi:formylglycine-generating enzyme required for sulfatase activity/tetratricopeptide (TPR) repeat protein